MGCRILVGTEEGSVLPRAVFFCSTTDWAFGPVMDDAEDARAFLRYLETVPVQVKYATVEYVSDPRVYGESVLREHYVAYLGRRTRCAVCDDRTFEGEAFTPDARAACTPCAERQGEETEVEASPPWFEQLRRDHPKVS